MPTGPSPGGDALVDEILSSTPLPFIREFLRSQKRESDKVHIGTTRKDARRNLKAAISDGLISLVELEAWYREIDGWGKQHLYVHRVGEGWRRLTHFLTTDRLRAFLRSKSLLPEPGPSASAEELRLEDVYVDDVYARLVWRSRADKWERHEELDYVKHLADDGTPDEEEGEEFTFRAWRRVPTRASSRLCFRKTDGAMVFLLSHPLGEDHDKAFADVDRVAKACLGACLAPRFALSAIVGTLDQQAIATAVTARVKHGVDLSVQSRQARFRTDGARVEFESTDSSHGYGDSEPARRVRRALRIEQFQGEMGKFRLTYEAGGQEHAVIASLDGAANRSYLFSRMTEGEVWAFVDTILGL